MALELADWIQEGEKFSAICIACDLTEDTDPVFDEGEQLAILPNWKITLNSEWSSWIGEIHIEEIKDTNLILVSKSTSETPKVLDGENQRHNQASWLQYIGLLLSSSFHSWSAPIRIGGGKVSSKLSLREYARIDPPKASIGTIQPAIDARDLRTAFELGKSLYWHKNNPEPQGSWRINRILRLYEEARQRPEIIDRIHQFSRCIEGLILASPGKTRRQFKSRTELFIGENHHNTMDRIYRIRSDVEHLNEDYLLSPRIRDKLLEIARQEIFISSVARHALTKIVANPILYGHFANREALSKFWELPGEERRAIWGTEFKPLELVNKFYPDIISNSELGIE
ncbi:hypothetical protein [Amorphus orientalis]|uniref:Uncharacterized protein n=1 Tax=Amorphus orientalis TaxID=649198 RepID=A0AAE4AUB9_9HYPH|nr:hypothetical protein [Amorphus orientalis]MDQ0317248.1 hypothetical protein [Amorphus orientalis]